MPTAAAAEAGGAAAAAEAGWAAAQAAARSHSHLATRRSVSALFLVLFLFDIGRPFIVDDYSVSCSVPCSSKIQAE